MKSCMLLLFCILLLAACKDNKPAENLTESTALNETTNAILPLKNAKNFIIAKHEHIQEAHWLMIPQAWAGAKDTLKYLVIPKEIMATMRLAPDAYTIIPTPIDRLVCTSTIQAAMCEKLGLADKIVAMAEADYLYNNVLFDKIQKGEIINLGSNQQLNFEKLLATEPELMLVFGLNAPPRLMSKLEDLQIPTLYMAEYLENSPLGRAEWIKVIALLFNIFEKGSSVFDNNILAPYQTIMHEAEKLAQGKKKPLVFTGLAFEGQWHISGGESFIAKMIKDAQGEYLYAQDKTTGTTPYAFEKVYVEAQHADIWLDVWQAKSKEDLVAINANNAKFAAFQNDKVFNYTKRISPNGGYDIFESAVIQPHLLLSDMLTIFYGEKADYTSLKYYTPLH